MVTKRFGNHIHVMVVDDSAVQLELFHRLINGMPDMVCTQASNDGRRALIILEGYTPDVLLISHMQEHPHITGLELLQQVHHHYPDLPVIYYAGPNAELRDAAANLGAECIIGMPLQLPQIVSAVRQAVGANV